MKFDRSATSIDYFAEIDRAVTAALAEDVGTGDLTARLIPANREAAATVIARESAVLCGTRWFDAVYGALDATVRVQWQFADGSNLKENDLVCRIAGNARAIVTGERTALNLLQTLSGTATATARYVARLAGTRTRLLDTRKTLPGLRRAQKYAVKCGGGHNHRAGLYDGVLIKENHIAAAGSIARAVAALRATAGIGIEVEVERIDQIDEAIEAGADMLLLDNFSLPNLRAAVVQTGSRVPLEASGGFDLEDLSAVAGTGVDFISIGALTKHVRAVDFSMRMSGL